MKVGHGGPRLYYTWEAGQESRVQGQPGPGTLVMVISDNWL